MKHYFLQNTNMKQFQNLINEHFVYFPFINEAQEAEEFD